MLDIEQLGMGEFHFIQQGKCGADIGAMLEGAAAAINDDVGVLWELAELLSEFG